MGPRRFLSILLVVPALASPSHYESNVVRMNARGLNADQHPDPQHHVSALRPTHPLALKFIAA